MADADLKRLERNTARRTELADERDRLIVEARASGISAAKIADAAGLTRMQIHRIVTQALASAPDE